ncbi:MAG TPA: glycoside hydrolase family 3 C-terminal domain-containing protein, partial [Chitinophaga sp.]
IAVVGPLANDQRDMIGSWSAAGDWHKAVSILDGIKAQAGNATVLYAKGANILDDSILIRKLNATGGNIVLDERSSQALIDEAVATTNKADVVVAALGETCGMSGEAASRSNLDIPANQRPLLEALLKTGKPVVLLLSNGHPLTLTWEDAHVPAIVETWFLGTEAGNAIADVLFGAYNPAGKLTMSFPRVVGQIPVYYNHKNTGRPFNDANKYSSKYLDVANEPLYPFGYGLSYTKFTYSNLKVDAPQLAPGKSLNVSVTVTNSGDYDGEEVVQLYLRDLVGSVTRPVKELKGFQKLLLRRGESQTLHFTLTPEDLKFYDKDMKWTSEPGDFKVFVGGNSRDVQSADFTLLAQ